MRLLRFIKRLLLPKLHIVAFNDRIPDVTMEQMIAAIRQDQTEKEETA